MKQPTNRGRPQSQRNINIVGGQPVYRDLANGQSETPVGKEVAKNTSPLTGQPNPHRCPTNKEMARSMWRNVNPTSKVQKVDTIVGKLSTSTKDKYQLMTPTDTPKRNNKLRTERGRLVVTPFEGIKQNASRNTTDTVIQ